jgi:hypothetical protein
MSDTAIAQHIFTVGINFLWPLVAGFILILIWSLSLGGAESTKQSFTVAVVLVACLSLFSAFTFLNIEGGEILQLARTNAAWGFYISILSTLTVSTAVYFAVSYLRSSRQVIDLLDERNNVVVNNSRRRLLLLRNGMLTAIPLWGISIFWLWCMGR